MKIIFDSKFEKKVFTERVSESNLCPDDFGLREDDDCFGCESCWKKALAECGIDPKEGAKENE